MIPPNKKSDKKRYVIYTRCSTDDQAQGDFTTLDAQAHHCKNMLDAFGHNLAKIGDKGVINDDGYSGKDPNRPGIQERTDSATFVGSEGWVSVSYQGVRSHPASLLQSKIGPDEIHLLESPSHQLSWVEAVKARKDPVGNIESAVRSDLVSHLCEISIRTGRPIRWNPKKETIVGDDKAKKRMSRPMRDPWKLL